MEILRKLKVDFAEKKAEQYRSLSEEEKVNYRTNLNDEISKLDAEKKDIELIIAQLESEISALTKRKNHLSSERERMDYDLYALKHQQKLINQYDVVDVADIDETENEM